MFDRSYDTTKDRYGLELLQVRVFRHTSKAHSFLGSEVGCVKEMSWF
jgi:hypothetical protein